jgi:hypothetical protein
VPSIYVAGVSEHIIVDVEFNDEVVACLLLLADSVAAANAPITIFNGGEDLSPPPPMVIQIRNWLYLLFMVTKLMH